MVSIQGLKVEFNSIVLFKDVNYVINKKDKIALVGKNGAGKSTMLKIIAAAVRIWITNVFIIIKSSLK